MGKTMQTTILDFLDCDELAAFLAGNGQLVEALGAAFPLRRCFCCAASLAMRSIAALHPG
jgi:hypothetical protein